MRRLAACCLLFLSALLVGAPEAAASSPYDVSGLQASAEGEDGVKAKEKALSAAMVEALRRVIERVAVGDRLPEPGAAQADALVSSFSFESESIGAARYGARILVRFDPDAVRRYLAAHGARVVDQQAPTILIVPVLVEEGVPRLWKEAEPWASAIAAEEPGERLAPAVLPGNGRSDGELDTDYLLGLAHLEVTELRMRYRAHSVLLAVAEPEGETVRLTLRGEDAVGLVDTAMDVAGGLEDAAAHLVATLQTRWKRALTGAMVEQAPPRSMLRGSVDRPGGSPPLMAVSGLSVRVLLRRGEDWTAIRRRLEASGAVAGLTLEHIEPGLAEVTLWPRSSPADLSARLGRQGLDLFRAGDAWMLQAY